MPLIRDAIEEAGIEKVDDYLGPNLYKKKVTSIKMMETKEGIKTLAGVI